MRKIELFKKSLQVKTAVLFLLLTSGLFAGVEPQNVRFISANMIPGARLTVADNKYPNVEVSGVSLVKSSVAQVVLGIDQSILSNSSTKFSVEVIANLKAYDKTGSIISTPACTLKVVYNKTLAGILKDKDAYVIKDCHKLETEIVSIKYTDAAGAVTMNPSSLPSIVYMESEIVTERFYAFSPTYSYPAASIFQNPLKTCPTCPEYELEISWPVIDGAEEYDLEWTHVNDYELTLPSVPDYSFKNNATRVTTTSNSYRISTMYEQGYILYRLRARGRDLTNTDIVVYGNWSASCTGGNCESGSVADYTNKYKVVAHDDHKNWQYNSTFAEDGKKKEVIGYFDGSLRNRQSITKNNSDNNLIIGENLYDFQGRPAVTILPFPLEQPDMYYREDLNLKTSTALFTKNDFDADNGSCINPSTPVISTNGASKYYSSDNLSQKEQQAYVPDANNYPYAQTEYTSDNTGRIRKQGGVGPDHKLGSGHETSYFYGQPAQSELDMMFGSEVGYNYHYKKNMVIDPNGQISISYIDMYGKTVATSLAGVAPDNVEALTSSGKEINEHYIKPDAAAPNPNKVTEDNALLFSSELLVNTSGTFEFAYDVDVPAYSNSCTEHQLCFNCVYDLSISILDDCGLEMLPSNTTYNTTVGTLDIEDFACNNVLKFTATPAAIEAVLPVGKYTVIKKLRVNEAVANTYVEQNILHNTCLKTLETFETEAMADIDVSGCHTNCQDCLESLGDYDTHNDATKADPLNSNYDPSYVFMTEEQYNLTKKECEEACNPITECDIMYMMMLGDVSPSGQYAQYKTLSDGSFDAAPFALSVLNTGNALPQSNESRFTGIDCPTGTTLPDVNPGNYKFPKITDALGAVTNAYLDEDGNPSKIILKEVAPGVFEPDYDHVMLTSGPHFDVPTNTYYVYPQELRYLKDFVEAFAENTSWARSLVEYHPEWGYYGLCHKLQDPTYSNVNGKSSEEFDEDLRNTETFADAVTKGYIVNNTSTLTSPSFPGIPGSSIPNFSNISSPFDLYYKDPYFNNDLATPVLSDNFNAKFEFAYNVLYFYKNNPDILSLKGVANRVVRCTNTFHEAPMHTPPCPGSGFGDPSYPYAATTADATEVLDREWRMYRDMYLSEKQKSIKNVISSLAKGSWDYSTPPLAIANSDGFYNGPIGIGSQYYNPWSHDMIDVSSWYSPNWIWPNITVPVITRPSWFDQGNSPRCYGYGVNDPLQPSFWGYIPGYTANYGYTNYANKTKRFVTIDQALPSGMSINSFNPDNAITLENSANYNIYKNTGQCPNTFVFQGFLNSLANNLTLANGTSPLVMNDFFLKSIYDQVINNHSDFFEVIWNPSITGGGTQLTGTFDAPTASSTDIGCTNLTLTYNGSNPLFGTTGAPGWNDIKHFSGIKFLNYASPDYNFSIYGYVDNDNNPLTAPDQEEFLGSTCIKLGGCDFADYCAPSQTANQLMGFINTLNSTETNTGTKDLVYTTSTIPLTTSGSAYTTVFTNLLKVPFISTSIPSPAMTWQAISSTASSLSGVLSNGTTSKTLTFNFGTHLISDIMFFDNAVPDASNPDKLVMDAYVGYATGGFPQFFPIELTISTTSTPDIKYQLGNCGLPPDASCQTPQHKTLEDMGNLFAEMKNNIAASSFDLSYTANYTTLLQSYVYAPANTTWASTTNPDNSLSVTIGTGDNACQLSISPLYSGTTINYADIIAFSHIYADASQLTNNGYAGNFTIIAHLNDGSAVDLQVKTSCFEFKNCVNCSETMPAGTYENFDYYPVSTSVPNVYPSINSDYNAADYPVCNVSETYYTLLNESIVPVGCEDCVKENHDESGLFNKNYLRFSPASSTSKKVWYKTVPVTPHTNYEFSFWFRSCKVLGNSLKGAIDSKTLVTIPFSSASNSTGEWIQVKTSWNSAENTSTELKIVSVTGTHPGLLDIDDISFAAKPCSPATETNFVPADTIKVYEPCDTMLTSIGNANALYAYQQYIDSVKKSFKQAYIAKCLSALETFSVNYTDRQYHYTLYYYDQAGNLIRTIPPAGVQLIDLNATNALTPAKTNAEVIGTDRDHKVRTLFTQHRLATTYEYNSLNQLIRQNTPDNDQMRRWSLTNTVSGLTPNLPNSVNIAGMDASETMGYAVGTDGTTNPMNGVIYTSADGVTWAPVSNVGFGDLNDVQETTSNTVYAISGTGQLLKSTDNGASWFVMSAPTLNSLNDLHFFSNVSGYVVGNGGVVYQTGDGGTTWSMPSAFTGFGTINFNAIQFTDANNGYVVGTGGTIVYTTNGGTSWSTPTTALNNQIDLTSVHFNPEGQAVNYATSATVPFYTGFVAGYDHATSDGRLIYIDNLTDVQVVAIPSSGPDDPKNHVSYSPVTLNGGTVAAKKLNSVTVGDPQSTPLDPLDNEVLAAGKDGEIYKVKNATATTSPPVWSGSKETVPSSYSSELTEVVYPVATNTTIAYAASKNGNILSLNVGSSNWANLSSFGNTTPINGFYYNGSNAYAVGNAGLILKSTNAGATWSNVTQLSLPKLNDISVNGPTIVAVGDNGNIVRSDDGGATWNILASTVSFDLKSVSVLGSGNSILVGESGKIYTLGTTGGPVLISSPPVSTDLNKVYFVTKTDNTTIGYIAGANGVILKSTDLGATWAAPPGGTSTSVNLKSIHAYENSVFAVGAGGKILKSDDNGTSFTDVSGITSENLNEVYLRDNLIAYAFGDNGTIVKTTDGGATWQLEGTQTGITHNAAVFITSTGALVGGSGSENLYSLIDLSNDHSSRFWYDKLGRLIISQNTKQFNKTTPAYSITRYDNLGRIKLVAEVASTTDPESLTNYNGVISQNDYDTWMSAVTPGQVTITLYDNDAPSVYLPSGFVQENLRHRVSAIMSGNATSLSTVVPEAASVFSYDIHGNVKTLIQYNPALASINQEFKRIDYTYDLISGKVNQVQYQKDQRDALYHQYEYDADNRLTNVYTSRNRVNWEQDAKYFYYKHGPLARTEIGDEKIQGLDYAYTLQGWIKGVNSNTLKEDRDQGKDGIPDASSALAYSAITNLNNYISKDAYGYSLHYYNGDYTAISAADKYDAAHRFDADPAANPHFAGSANNELFNGNIMAMATAIPTYAGGAFNLTANTQISAYRYDQLNRLRTANVYNANGVISSNAWASASTISHLYENNFTYDANGNILTQDRWNDAGTQVDALQYKYDLDGNGNFRSNRLYHVNDGVGTTPATDDIENQGTFTGGTSTNPTQVNTLNNYGYDEIGNLVRDKQEHIANIDWTVYGKIRSITRDLTATDQPDLEFIYDPMGNRIAKIVKGRTGGVLSASSQWVTTYYVRDAQGNVMATYEDDKGAGTYKLKDFSLYGSSRLGNLAIKEDLVYNDLTDISTSQYQYSHEKGHNLYQLNNHLGNVLTVVTDRRIATDDNSDGTIDTYIPEVISATDYYSFGSPMPGRKFNSNAYKYGFNGKENDGSGASASSAGEGTQDYGMRIYNPSLGKFLSIDPITDEYPELTPYQFASNRPIDGIDLDGLEYCSYDTDSKDPNVKEMARADGVTNYRDSKNYQIFNEARDRFSGSGGIVDGMGGEIVGIGLVKIGSYLYKSYKASKTMVKVVTAEKIAVKTEQGISKIKSAYQTAKEGGKHSGFYKEFLTKPIKQLESALTNLSKSIEEHIGFLKDPAKALADKKAKNKGVGKLWDEMTKLEQEGTLKSWQKEINTRTEQKEVIEGIISEAKPNK